MNFTHWRLFPPKQPCCLTIRQLETGCFPVHPQAICSTACRWLGHPAIKQLSLGMFGTCVFCVASMVSVYLPRLVICRQFFVFHHLHQDQNRQNLPATITNSCLRQLVTNDPGIAGLTEDVLVCDADVAACTATTTDFRKGFPKSRNSQPLMLIFSQPTARTKKDGGCSTNIDQIWAYPWIHETYRTKIE